MPVLDWGFVTFNQQKHSRNFKGSRMSLTKVYDWCASKIRREDNRLWGFTCGLKNLSSIVYVNHWFQLLVETPLIQLQPDRKYSSMRPLEDHDHEKC